MKPSVQPALTPQERSKLQSCMVTIRNGLTTFCEVAVAFMTIRDQRLYRETHDSFEVFCFDHWGIRRQRLHQLIQGAEVVKNIQESEINGVATSPTTVGRNPTPLIPNSERQTRPLASLPAPEQREAWDKAVESAGGQQPTSGQVKEAVAEVKAKREPRPRGEPEDSMFGPKVKKSPPFDLGELHELYQRMRKLLERFGQTFNRATSIELTQGLEDWMQGLDGWYQDVLTSWKAMTGAEPPEYGEVD
jgi:hypothetical protein